MRRELLIILATVVGTLGTIALLDSESQSQVDVCVVDEAEREIIRTIVMKGIDQALEDQIGHVFAIWMKDHTEQPKRAVVGTNIAVNAYVRARSNILKWDPQVCESAYKLQSVPRKP